MQRGNGLYSGPNFDLFSVNGGVTPPLPAEPVATVPAVFPAPLPKYDDAFPHQRPGQIEELLREEELDDEDEEGESSEAGGVNEDAVYNQGRVVIPNINNNNNLVVSKRESKYVCREEEETY